MAEFTRTRTDRTNDEIWCLQHPPVFTLGRAGRPEHILAAGDIPVVQSDRGGQVTYHGPGQLVVYLLIDLKRIQVGVRDMVRRLESAVISALDRLDICSQTRAGAPGVYVENEKIASLGLRVSRGRSYHGLSLNVDLDLKPFERINTCGYPDLTVTSLRTLGVAVSCAWAETVLLDQIARHFHFDQVIQSDPRLPC